MKTVGGHHRVPEDKFQRLLGAQRFRSFPTHPAKKAPASRRGRRSGKETQVVSRFPLGFLLSGSFQQVILLFPKPVLGIILFFEGLALLLLVRDTADSKSKLLIVLLVGLLAASVPYGYVTALVTGTAIAYWGDRQLTSLTK